MGKRSTLTASFTCTTCEIDIAGLPTFERGLPFCCPGCVANGPCTCSYDAEPDERQVRYCLDVEGAVRAALDQLQDA